MSVLARLAPAVAGFLLLQELALRAVFPLPEVSNFDRGAYSHMGFTPDDAAPTALGHLSFRWASEPDGFEFVHALNLYGFRDVEWRRAKRAGVPRIAFLGDSFVEGFSAPAEDSIPSVVRERAQRAGAPLDVLNLGVGGGDLPAYARLLRDALRLFAPDRVVLVLFANDVLPTRLEPGWADAPLAARETNPWQPRLAYVAARLRAGLWTPRRWHEPPFDFLPKVPDPRNPWSDGRRAGQLEAFVAPEIARAIRAGRFNPMLTDALGWFRRHLQRPISIEQHVVAFARHARAAGASFEVVYIPTKNQVSDRYLAAQARFSPPEALGSQLGDAFQVQARLLGEACRAAQVPFLDLTPLLRDAEPESGPLYWEHDDHMRPAGYRLAGAAIRDWLVSEGVGPER